MTEIRQTPEPGEPAMQSAAAGAELVKVSMNLAPWTVDVVRDLSRTYGTTMAEVVQRGIGLQKVVADEIEKGGKLLIEDSNGRLKRVVFP